MKEFEWPQSTWPPRDESGIMVASRQFYADTGQTVEEAEAEPESPKDKKIRLTASGGRTGQTVEEAEAEPESPK